ncbi:hypothetical protein E2C01_086632 [Portunus trituberculatus]|uniref:Endonuclease/exonuclease/phosphatase domain-containing protein n=1 Tax=Portunus trituberculatus TaxID=210409 RepID=A0A5B7JBZ6_PORTR|nr:hypothetical protein [Portunus trituberculatus]
MKYPAAKLVICGDFNRLDVSEILHQLSLNQVVNFPTLQQAKLDLIMTDLHHHYSSPKPLPPVGRSTHLSILWSPASTTSPQLSKVMKTYRPMPDSALRLFGEWVTQHSWNEVLQVEDVHTKWLNFVSITSAAYYHCFPAKSVTVHPHDDPWMMPHIKRFIKQRN